LEAIGEATHRLAAKTIAFFDRGAVATYDRFSSISRSLGFCTRHVSQILDGIYAFIAVGESPPPLKMKRSNVFERRYVLR